MEKKLIFLDIDGTLLAPGEMMVTPVVLDALHRARANGHKVFLCTGRNYRMTAPLLSLDFDGFVCSAGGYVCCDGKVLVDIPMEPEQVEGIRAALLAHGADCTLEAKHDTFGGSEIIQRFAERYKEQSELNSEAARWYKAVKDGMTIRPLSEYNGEPVYKIAFAAPDDDTLREVREKYEDQFVFCTFNMGGRDGFVNGELINRKFNKGTGIQAICDFLGRSMADTIGFGDSDNDLQMAEAVGLSVCMANGSENMKKICDRICPSVYEDGLAKELATLGLI